MARGESFRRHGNQGLVPPALHSGKSIANARFSPFRPHPRPSAASDWGNKTEAERRPDHEDTLHQALSGCEPVTATAAPLGARKTAGPGHCPALRQDAGKGRPSGLTFGDPAPVLPSSCAGSSGPPPWRGGPFFRRRIGRPHSAAPQFGSPYLSVAKRTAKPEQFAPTHFTDCRTRSTIAPHSPHCLKFAINTNASDRAPMPVRHRR